MEQLSLVISHRYRGPKHCAGTPGLVPYQSRTVNTQKARHRKKSRLQAQQITLALASITAGILLLLSGYRAAEGAAIILSMF